MLHFDGSKAGVANLSRGQQRLSSWHVYLFCTDCRIAWYGTIVSSEYMQIWVQIFILCLKLMAGQTVFTGLKGLAEAWDSSQRIRRRVREIGCVVAQQPEEGKAEEDGPIGKTTANVRYNKEALMPILELMKGHFQYVPCLESWIYWLAIHCSCFLVDCIDSILGSQGNAGRRGQNFDVDAWDTSFQGDTQQPSVESSLLVWDVEAAALQAYAD